MLASTHPIPLCVHATLGKAKKGETNCPGSGVQQPGATNDNDLYKLTRSADYTSRSDPRSVPIHGKMDFLALFAATARPQV